MKSKNTKKNKCPKATQASKNLVRESKGK